MENENNESLELIVSDVQEQKAITFNYEHFKNILSGKLEVYKNTIYTEDNISEAKADRAKLNKLSKALNDEKKRVKNELLKPYIDFETKVKELIGIVDEATITVDNQIKSFEEKDKQEKLEEIIKYFDEKNVDYKGLIDFDKIFQNEWLNKTYTLKKVQMNIDHIFARTNQDIEMFEETFKNEKDILIQAKQIYFENINEPTVATLTMQKVNEIKEFNKKMADTEQNITKTEEKITNSVQNVANEEKVGRVFKIVCTYEKLKELNNFLVSRGGYETEVLERF